ncbi:hypothetical protein [Zhongshania borealis]|uniref:Uncharacterized protein n=1 Tax=Zhongshania borealis TaxID=889488 RepID=A0ABP7WWR9_9GAMM
MAKSESINLSIPLIGNIALVVLTSASGLGTLPTVALCVALVLSATALSH